jgi:hypothetical protein
VPLKETGAATDWREVDRWERGIGWIAHPGESLLRTSHAFAVDGDVWVVDRLAVPGLDRRLAEFGEVAGVVVLFTHHERDAATVAKRHDVPVYVSPSMAALAEDLDIPVQPVRAALPDTEYAVYDLIDNPLWREAFLYSEDTGQLILADALGTAPRYLTADERLGVHPALRISPPRRLGRLSPERIDLGHGEGVTENPGDAIADGLDGARWRAPRLFAGTIRDFLLP